MACGLCEKARRFLPDGMAQRLADIERRREQERPKHPAPGQRPAPQPEGTRQITPTGRSNPVTSRRGRPLGP